MSVFSEQLVDFRSTPLHSDVVRQLEFLAFKAPTRIQAAAIAPICSGKDVLIQSSTGTGKTIAFAAPMLHRLKLLMGAEGPSGGISRTDGAYAIILSPTKELCLQTFTVVSKLARMMPNIIVGHVAGGDNPQKEKARLRKGLTIVCATPGRLVYHLESTQSFRRDKVQMLILDEADRLLDMGFEKQIKRAYELLGGGESLNRQWTYQVVMVSATLSPKVKDLAAWCLSKNNSVYVREGDDVKQSSVKAVENRKDGENDKEPEPKDFECRTQVEVPASTPSKFTVPLRLTQKIAVVDLKFKLICFIGSLLEAQASGCRRVVVFFNSCASVEFYHGLFGTMKWPSFEKYGNQTGPLGRREMKRKAVEIEAGEVAKEVSATGQKVFTKMSMNILHGDLNSTDRVGAMMDFQKPLSEMTSMRVLLCTDVAARGVDVSQVDLVIQYDPPQQTDEYLHRIGRTARIGNEGEALLFLSPNETSYVDHIRSKCQEDIHFVKVSQKSLIAECQKFNPESVAHLKDFPLFLNSFIAQQVAAVHDLDQLARKAFLSSLRAYRTFQGWELRDIFNVKDLHGGHLAASFGLTDCPKSIAISMQEQKQKDFAKRDARQAHHKKRRFDHNLKLRQPKEVDPPARMWQGPKPAKPQVLKPFKPVSTHSAAAMEFQA